MDMQVGFQLLGGPCSSGGADCAQIPFMYCFSEHLVPKPEDWGPNVDITGALTMVSSRRAGT